MYIVVLYILQGCVLPLAFEFTVKFPSVCPRRNMLAADIASEVTDTILQSKTKFSMYECLNIYWN